MIPNPIIYNDTTIMIGLIVCCLVVLAAVMIPKAIRHRKQVKQNENEKAVQDGQELEMIVVPSEEHNSTDNYQRRFLVNANIPTRNGKQVAIRQKYHNRISKIVKTIGDNEISIFSYIDNVLKHHFETFQEDISELYKKNIDDDYLSPKK